MNEISSLDLALQKTSVHDHLCLLYENKEEQFATAIPFIRIGLERGEKCIYINDDNSADEVLNLMRTGDIDVDTALKNGSLSIISKREAYLRNGYFDPDEMIQFLKESTDQAKKEGFKALRATGEMTWMLGDEPGIERALEYEAKLNNFFSNHDCLALCQYNKKRFDPKLLIDVVRTHPIVVASGIVCKNFYYVPVEEFLKIKNGSRRELERFLQNLIEREQVEQERLNSLKFINSLDKINQVIQKANGLEQMMNDALGIVLSIFDCDRAWLLYPSDPDTVSFTVPMERTKPEYPGALAAGVEVPTDPETRRVFETARLTNAPVTFTPESDPPIPSAIAKNFQVKSQLVINIYPKIGSAYMFGLHQCSFERFWTDDEKRLFEEIARRLTDGLTSLLIFRDLQKSKNQYQNVLETANEGIWMLNKEHELTFVNPRLLAILGYEKKEILGQKLANFVISEELADHDFQMRERNKGKSGDFERRLRNKNGDVIWTRISAVPLFDDKNQVIGAFAMITDITDRKLGEIELIRINRVLKMLSETNQALIHITDEVELLNKISEIIISIGGYHMMWIGYAEHDAVKTVRPVVQAGLSGDYISNLHVSWAEEKYGQGPTGLAIRTGKTQLVDDVLTDPKMLPWRELAIKYGYRSSISLPLISNKLTFGTLNIYISEPNAFTEAEIVVLEELANDLAFGIATLRMRIQTSEHLKEIDQLKNKFIQIVSHQLLTPLSVIRWNLEMLLERKRGELSSAQEEILRGTYSADLEIISRIDDLMIALDIEEGRLRLDIEKIDIGEMIHSVCEEKLQASVLKKITHEIILPTEPLPAIESDVTKISDVVARLIDNAIAYTPETGHIRVKYFELDGKIRFEITDTGIGIPVAEKPHIFERFHRGWNAALMRPNASGLGLFISKNYIEAHHGTIGFTSTEKKGSTFWFELPVTMHNN